MSDDPDWAPFGVALIGTWPAARWDETLITAYIAEISARGVSPEEAVTAIRESSSDFVMSAGAIAASVERKRQGRPPDYAAAMRMIAGKVTLLNYFNPTTGWVRFIEALSREHEAVARFAVEIGPKGVRGMPDPRFQQGTGGSIEGQRLVKSYRETVKAWEETPTRGVASDEAERLVSGADAKQLGGGMKGTVSRLRPRPQGELEPGDGAA